MTKATKRVVITLTAAVCLTVHMTSAHAQDVTTPPVQAPTQTDTLPPTAPPEIATPPLTLAPNPTSPDEDKWVFTAPLYVWAAGLSGSVTAKGRRADVDASASDIFHHADFGFMGYFELDKSRFGFYAQPTYLKLSDSASAGPLRGNVRAELWIVEFAALYKFYEWQGDHHGSLAGLAGGRYWSLDNALTVHDNIGNRVSGSASGDLFDPIFGMRYEQYITKKLHVWFQGDIGGFGISDSQSRFSWQTIPLLGYDFIMPVIKKPSTVFAGYRVLSVQHTSGGGTNQRAYHLNMEGAVIGLNVVLF